MNCLTRKHKLILLFLCGFLIGLCLEVIFIEKQYINFNRFKKSLNSNGNVFNNVNITCLVLLKSQHSRFINSSKRTWLKHCTNYQIVKIHRAAKPKPEKIITAPTNHSKTFQDLIKSTTICLENDDVHNITTNNAWSGLCQALQFVELNHTNWLIIIPDSSVVIVENLKHFVQNLNFDESHYYGYTVKNYEADYNILSAGILLSRRALFKLLEVFKTKEDCDRSGKYWKNEDLYLGKHLKQLNILPKDSRDENGRGRFHGYNLNNILWPGRLFKQSDYHKKALYPVSEGFKCCSPFLISLEVSNSDSMHKLYFLLYKIKTKHQQLPDKIKINKTEEQYWKHFLKQEGYNEEEINNMTNEEYYKIWERKLPMEKMLKELHNFLAKDKLIDDDR